MGSASRIVDRQRAWHWTTSTSRAKARPGRKVRWRPVSYKFDIARPTKLKDGFDNWHIFNESKLKTIVDSQ